MDRLTLGRRRAQEFRQRRRGIPSAEQVAARVTTYHAKEAEKMAEFQSLVGGYGGDKMHIPRRE